MQDIEQTGQKGVFARWFQAVRVFSMTASMIPILVSVMLAAAGSAAAGAATGAGGAAVVVAWWMLPLVVAAALLFQVGTNLVSDYFDYKNDVDKDYTYGSSRVIVEGYLSTRQILAGGIVAFALGCAIGVVFVIFRGWPILVIGLVGLLGGIFYTARPLGYKYIAMGDLLVFAQMGPLMVIGSYYVLTGGYDGDVLLVSLPVGFLVAAILQANNMRDIRHDNQAKVCTMATVLGHNMSRLEYYALVSGAYAAVVAMVLAAVLPAWSLLVFVTVPIATRNFAVVHRSQPNQPESIATLDVQTAQLHLTFGVLLAVSILLGVLF